MPNGKVNVVIWSNDWTFVHKVEDIFKNKIKFRESSLQELPKYDNSLVLYSNRLIYEDLVVQCCPITEKSRGVRANISIVDCNDLYSCPNKTTRLETLIRPTTTLHFMQCSDFERYGTLEELSNYMELYNKILNEFNSLPDRRNDKIKRNIILLNSNMEVEREMWEYKK